ncbi:MAG: fatty acid desaturase family protein [Alphaproteobacteria bacterium]|nr:fatty acid desaturase family protein [Alphaproteobacteria bacterium]MBV9061731.1 fatty acid desaturase family protein [Alphaproteobacteria bacterium]
MALFALWPNPLTFVLAVLVIGSRQLGLAILMHDGAHGVLMRTRARNEWISQWLCAFPVFADTIPYRHYHLQHHRSTQQPDDPDLVLSTPFPITKSSFRRKMIRDVTGQTGFKQRRAQIKAALGESGEPLALRFATFRRKLGGPLIVNAVLLALLSAFGRPHYYLLFWLFPLLTWQQVITRIRNIAEHAVVPDNDDVLRNARTTYASFLERAFVAPYWVNYHVDHHALMYVPCFNLPKLHALLLARGYGPQMEIQPSYLAMLRLALSKPEPAALPA